MFFVLDVAQQLGYGGSRRQLVIQTCKLVCQHMCRSSDPKLLIGLRENCSEHWRGLCVLEPRPRQPGQHQLGCGRSRRWSMIPTCKLSCRHMCMNSGRKSLTRLRDIWYAHRQGQYVLEPRSKQPRHNRNLRTLPTSTSMACMRHRPNSKRQIRVLGQIGRDFIPERKV